MFKKNSKIEIYIFIGLPLCDVSISKPPTVQFGTDTGTGTGIGTGIGTGTGTVVAEVN
jgi:hypothetical protein